MIDTANLNAGPEICWDKFFLCIFDVGLEKAQSLAGRLSRVAWAPRPAEQRGTRLGESGALPGRVSVDVRCRDPDARLLIKVLALHALMAALSIPAR